MIMIINANDNNNFCCCLCYLQPKPDAVSRFSVYISWNRCIIQHCLHYYTLWIHSL